jgi:hypothetical protein
MHRVELLRDADLSVPADLTAEPRGPAEQFQRPLKVAAAAGNRPPGIHQRPRLIGIPRVIGGPLLILSRGRLTPQIG